MVFSVPVSAMTRLAARLTVACAFAVLFVVPVVLVGVLFGGVRADPEAVPGIVGAILAGSVPMGLMGLAMGYWIPVRGALGLAMPTRKRSGRWRWSDTAALRRSCSSETPSPRARVGGGCP